ncbi:MAG: hypothetical protein NTW64_01815 [Candidatus Omnitrophica bacterium]|nr:hypothetical protein [Candidatus Omnitrophota bacterium]
MSDWKVFFGGCPVELGKMKKLIGIFIIAVFILLPFFGYSEEDGTYDATVTTDSGSYTAPVEVEDGEVTQVHWPNGGDMTVSGAEISEDGEASGTNSRDETVDIEIDDYNTDSTESEE